MCACENKMLETYREIERMKDMYEYRKGGGARKRVSGRARERERERGMKTAREIESKGEEGRERCMKIEEKKERETEV